MKSKPLIISFVVSIAAFMEILDTTVTNVALTHIAGDLSAGMEESTWILTSYLVTNAIILPVSGWCSEKFGRKRYFIGCIAGFTLASFLCGIATSLPALVFFRLIQGLAGGGLQPSQQAIIKDSFPPQKLGSAFAIVGIVNVCAPILGPALGGYITDNLSWRWIFFINVPVGILTAVLVKKLVPDSQHETASSSIDYIGFVMLAVGLGTLQVALDNAQQYDWFASSGITALFAISFISIIATIIWLLRQKNPIVNIRLFKIPRFTIGCIMMFFTGTLVNVSVMLLPMLVQKYFGYDATTAGLILVPGGIIILLLMPVTGKSLKIFKPKYLIAFGMFVSAGSMLFSEGISLQSDKTYFTLVRVLQILGSPFLFVPTLAVAFSDISTKESNNASAIISLMKNLGGSFGISLITSYLDHRQQIEQSYLASHLTFDHIGYALGLNQYTAVIQNLHIPSLLNSNTAAYGTMMKLYQSLQLQADILAYIDTFRLLGCLFLALAFVALALPAGKKQVAK